MTAIEELLTFSHESLQLIAIMADRHDASD